MSIRLTGTLVPIGAFPVCTVADVTDACSDTEAAAIRAGAPRVYDTCAAVRVDTTAATTNQTIHVKSRGMFNFTTSGGTDSGTEYTDYITVTGGGFALGQDTYRDYVPMANAPTYKVGRVWNDGTSLNLMTDVPEVTIQLGEEEQVLVYNGGTPTLSNGYACYAYGPQGQRLDCRLAYNDVSIGCRCIGLATHNIVNKANGRITTSGLVHDLNTLSLTSGGEVFTSQTPGVLSATQPLGTEDGARIGWCVNRHATDGTILVNVNPIPRLAGTTANRPTSPRIGEQYFDTTINCVIVWNGTAWQLTTRPGYADLIGDVNHAAAVAALTSEAYSDTPFPEYFFRHDQDDTLYLKFQMPHDWDCGVVEPHVHVIGCASVTGNVRMVGRYCWSSIHGNLAVPIWTGWTSFAVTSTLAGSDQWIPRAISLGSFTPPSTAQHPSAFLRIQLIRPGNTDSLDTYTGSKPDHTAAANLMLEGVDCHVMRTGLGTASFYS